jgi:hypothetical protein
MPIVSQQGPPPSPGWGTPPPPRALGWGQPPPGGPLPPGQGPQPVYSQYGWGGPPPAPKPGVIPLRPLGVGDVLEATLATLRRYPAATLASSAVVVGVVTLLQLALLWPTVDALTGLPDPSVAADPQEWLDELARLPWAALLVGSVLVGLLSFVLVSSLAGLLAVVVGQAVLGRPLGFADAWRRAGTRVPRLLVTVVLVGLAVGAVWLGLLGLWLLLALTDPPVGLVVAVVLLSLLVALPLSLFLGVRLALATPAVMLESDAAGPIGPATAVRRSWRLVSGAWWRTFGIVLLGAVIAGALSQVVAVPLNIVASALALDPTVAVLAGLVAAGIGQAVALPVSGLVLGLVYVDRRIRAEQLDMALAQASAQ